MDENHLYFL